MIFKPDLNLNDIIRMSDISFKLKNIEENINNYLFEENKISHNFKQSHLIPNDALKHINSSSGQFHTMKDCIEVTYDTDDCQPMVINLLNGYVLGALSNSNCNSYTLWIDCNEVQDYNQLLDRVTTSIPQQAGQLNTFLYYMASNQEMLVKLFENIFNLYFLECKRIDLVIINNPNKLINDSTLKEMQSKLYNIGIQFMMITCRKLVTPILKKLKMNEQSFNISNNPPHKIKDNSAIIHLTNHHLDDSIKNKYEEILQEVVKDDLSTEEFHQKNKQLIQRLIGRKVRGILCEHDYSSLSQIKCLQVLEEGF